MPTWLHTPRSGSRWVITQSWLSSLLRSFFVYSCCLFLISSASVRSIIFLSFIVSIFACNVALVYLIFLRSLVFPFYCFPLFLSIVHLGSLSYLSLLFFGTLHSDWYIFPFPLPLVSLVFLAICKASSDNHFAFLHLYGLDHCLLYNVTNFHP